MSEYREFRYLGKSVVGEKTDEHGNVMPDIRESVTAYGFEFHARKYTKVPVDAKCSGTWHFNKRTRKHEYIEPLVVDKLANNREFQEREDTGAGSGADAGEERHQATGTTG